MRMRALFAFGENLLPRDAKGEPRKWASPSDPNKSFTARKCAQDHPNEHTCLVVGDRDRVSRSRGT